MVGFTGKLLVKLTTVASGVCSLGPLDVSTERPMGILTGTPLDIETRRPLTI